MRELWLGQSVNTAVSTLRLHHQLLPPYVQYEDGFDQVSVLALLFTACIVFILERVCMCLCVCVRACMSESVMEMLILLFVCY